MTSILKSERFRSLHIPGDPILLVNAWDAGSAKAIVEAGCPAIATSGWAVAAESIRYEVTPQNPRKIAGLSTGTFGM